MSLLRTLATALNARGDLHDGERAARRDRRTNWVVEPAKGFRPDEGFTTLFVTACDDLLLNVRIYGSRTNRALPVVCLPGFGRTAADFHTLATALAADPAGPRFVVALDYRGHGQSEYDSNPDNYGLHRDARDLWSVVRALNLAPAVFVGSSHGGFLALMLARSQPHAIAGLVLNDVGPVIEPRVLLQIKGYLGKLPIPRDFKEGGELLRKVFGARFPGLAPHDWTAFAERTWREHRGVLAPDYDVRLARALDTNLEHPPPTLWDAFEALASVPLMVIRGVHSTMLTAPTLDGMLARRDEIDMVVVPDQGHAPLLEDPKLVRRIAAFVASCDAADGAGWKSSAPADRPPVAQQARVDRLQERRFAQAG